MSDGIKKHYTDVGCPKGYSWQILESEHCGWIARIYDWSSGKPALVRETFWNYRATAVSWLVNEFKQIKQRNIAPNY